MQEIIVEDFKSYKETIPKILERLELKEKIKNQEKILIKPNLTTNQPFPCTTSVDFVEEVIKYCLENSKAEIIIAEGSGGCDTEKAFKDLGYYELAKKYKIKLIDLNKTERIKLENEKALVLKTIFLPRIVFESFIINLPVLKIHSEAKLTAAMKNLFGFYLNTEFLVKEGDYWVLKKDIPAGYWNKSELHYFGVHKAIIDLNKYINVGFHLVDGSIGQLKSEVYGIPADPPIGKIIAGYDAKLVDVECAKLLKLNPENIFYLKHHN